ncbi:hypothetical protein ACVWZR_006218 [Bradyrhizobium sp. i1.3.1]
MMTRRGIVGLDALSHVCGELTRRQLGGIDLLKPDKPRIDVFLQVQAKCPGARFDRAAAFIEREEHRVLATFGRRDRVGERNR